MHSLKGVSGSGRVGQQAGDFECMSLDAEAYGP